MNKRHLIRKKSNILGGVCSGLAFYLHIKIHIVRIMILILFFYFSLEVATFYVLAWILILPEPKESFKKKVFYQKLNDNNKLTTFKSSNSLFLGVCKGIALKFNLNVFGVRMLFMISGLFFGLGVVLYFILSFCLPSRSDYEVKLKQRIEILKQKINAVP